MSKFQIVNSINEIDLLRMRGIRGRNADKDLFFQPALLVIGQQPFAGPRIDWAKEFIVIRLGGYHFLQLVVPRHARTLVILIFTHAIGPRIDYATMPAYRQATRLRHDACSLQ